VAPWTIRNYRLFGAFVPVSTQTGMGFYSSYCPKDGVFGLLADPLDPVVVGSREYASPALSSDYLVKCTIEYIINNPKTVLKLEVKKFAYFWAPIDWEMTGGRWFNYPYAVMLPFFAIGVVLAIRQPRKYLVVLIPIIYFQVITLIFYGSPRFRFPVDPFIIMLSAFAITVILENIKNFKLHNQ